MQVRVESAGATRQGLRRSRNEDAFVVVRKLGLCLIADGVGGNPCGDVAAQMAVHTVREFFQTNLDMPEELRLIAGVQAANKRMFLAGLVDPALRGMASTFAGVCARTTHFCMVHLGHSRIYRLREGRLVLLTRDHTRINEAVWRGVRIDEAEALPDKHALTRALGPRRVVQVDGGFERPEPGDILLLSTNGITNMLSHAEIGRILREGRDVDAMPERLIADAVGRGAPDDMTAIVMRWTAQVAE